MPEPIIPPEGGAPADQGNGQPTDGAGQGDGGGQGFQMPEKFVGKTAEEIAASYGELEKKLGQGGNTQEQIDQIATTLKEMKDALTAQKPGAGDGEGEDVVAARQKEWLKGMGFVTREEVEGAKTEAKKEVLFENRVSKLEDTYNGSDGRPKFDRATVAKYAQEHELWVDPETVYKIMHEKELIDWHIKQATKKGNGPHVPAQPRSGVNPPSNKKSEDMTDKEFKENLTAKLESRQ